MIAYRFDYDYQNKHFSPIYRGKDQKGAQGVFTNFLRIEYGVESMVEICGNAKISEVSQKTWTIYMEANARICNMMKTSLKPKNSQAFKIYVAGLFDGLISGHRVTAEEIPELPPFDHWINSFEFFQKRS